MGEMQFIHFFSFFILFFSHHHHTLCVGNVKLPAPNFLEDIAINCGCFTNSTTIDGRQWIGETPLLQLKGKSKTSTSSSLYKLLTNSVDDPTPYLTSRISSTHFSYIFLVNPGQKFIRFHFSPAPYHGFENSRDLFIVKANSFTLLDDFSPSFAADSLGVKYIVKEFCLNVNETGILQISFFASQRSRKRSKIHAFVNGIEIISMPTGLYYTPDDNLGARVIGQSNGFYKIDSSIALELIHRLNVGGGSISPVEDTGMFRKWSEDAEHVDNLVTSTESMDRLPRFAAPLKIYETSRRMRKNLHVDEQYYLTVKTLVDLGFGYLLRLHFCDLGVGSLESVGEEFDMLIQNIVVETRVDVILWSGGYGIPVYRDYLVMMKGDESEGKYDLFISLQSASKQAGGQLKGLEIFKLSNGNNSLASPYFSSLERDIAFWTLKSDIFAVAFGQINVFMTLFTILLALVNTVVYMLSRHFEGESWHKKAEQAAPVEASCRFFSLEEILLATQNFSDTLVIGRGGFGQVYKGFVYGCPEVLAIKRSKPGSKQGAHEFWREIETLSKLRHIHLVSLVGYCNESNELILVYEYMPRCTLADNLYKANKKGMVGIPLSWEQRLRICIGAARGIDYLHSGTKHGIVHRDVKDTNILLDENLIAKISDFGLAELGKTGGTHGELSTRVRGTMGYLDPDFLRTRNLSVKTDVYAFGMVLLVVLSARPALERKLFAETWSLLSCYRDCIKKGDINPIIDSCLQGEISTESLTIFMEAVKNCLHKQPKKRPTMAQVVVHLEQALEKQQGLPPCISDDETVISQPSQAGPSEPFEFYELKVIESKASSPPVSRHSATATTYSLTASPVSIYYLSGLRNTLQPHIYDFSMISSATNNFQLKPLSSSSSSTTWRCIMHNQEVILIQRRLRHPMKIPELTERFGLVCKSHHASLVKLNGASISMNYIYFVYDYIHGGNLADCLRNPGNPHFSLLSSWMSRIKIAADIADGLDYIHHSSGLSFNFVHNHIKSTSIIVTPNLKAKLCHFGTAELCREVIVNEKLDSKRSASLEMKFEGTTCYMAPEFQETGMATQKSDIYAFGMVILELLSGKDPLECRVDNGGYVKVSLIETGRQAMENNGIGVRRWVDKRLNDSFPVPVAEKLARLGLECLSENSDKRPDIRAVAAWISRLFVESEIWLVEKMGVFPQDISDSLIPR